MKEPRRFELTIPSRLEEMEAVHRVIQQAIDEYRLSDELAHWIELTISESMINAIQRHEGFQSAMTDAGMNVVTSQSAEWETDKATPLVSSIINAHPEIKAILCANDSMCLGAHTALKDAGKIGQVQLVGFDNIAAVQELVKNGDVLCTVDQHADQIAVNGIEYALEVLKTHAQPTDKETPVDLVTAETLGAKH